MSPKPKLIYDRGAYEQDNEEEGVSLNRGERRRRTGWNVALLIAPMIWGIIIWYGGFSAFASKRDGELSAAQAAITKLQDRSDRDHDLLIDINAHLKNIDEVTKIWREAEELPPTHVRPIQ